MKQFKLIIGISVLMIAFAALVGCVPPNLTAYSITYNGNGNTEGNVKDTALYLEGNAVPVLGQGNLVKPDYVFAGWRLQESQDRLIVDRAITVIEDDGTFTFFEGSTFNMPAHNVVLYAQWQLQSFSITYGNMAGATNHADNPASYTSATPTITLGNPSKPGHDFLGWYEAENFSGAVVTSLATGSTGNKTLFANWAPSQYTVTFDAQSGSSPDPATIEVTYGGTYGTLASTSRTGYDFLGWFTGTNGSGIKVSAPIAITTSSSHTLYAQWQLQSFSITYDNMAGATNHADNPASYTSATPTITLGNPSKPGHDFLGWYAAADFSGVAVTTIPAESTGAKVLFANWAPSQYTVTFDAQNGIAPNPATTEVSYGGTYGALATTSRIGHDFLGWFTGTNGSGTEVTETSTVIATNHHTLYAYWKTAIIPVESVSIIGDTIIGTELLATPYPLNTTANYRWQIADTSDGAYTNIPGASSWTYVIKPADEGKYLRVVANGTGSYTGTTISQPTKKIIVEGVGITAENFNTHAGQDYKGINVGFRLENITPSQVDSIKVELYAGEELLATNTAKQNLFGLSDLQHSTPFIITEGTYFEEYWNMESYDDHADRAVKPTRAVITVEAVDRVYTATNTNLSEATASFDFLFISQSAGLQAENFNTHTGTDYKGINVGFRLIDLVPSQITSIKVELFAVDVLLATNTAKQDLFALTDIQHSTPFIIIEGTYVEEYWNIGLLGNWLVAGGIKPTKAVITIVVAGETFSVTNPNLDETTVPFDDLGL